MTYEALILDAERRIGSYIASGGGSEDRYVRDQVAKIKDWTEQSAQEFAEELNRIEKEKSPCKTD